MTQRVCVVALPSVLGSAVCGPMDVLGTANLIATKPLFSVSIRTPAKEPVLTSYGLPLSVKHGLPRAQQHAVIVPGFGVTRTDDAVAQVVAAVEKHRRLGTWLRRQAAGGALIAANCVGTFVLAEAGLLDGRPATTTWWLEGAFAERYPGVHLDASALLTRAGEVVTAGAAMSHLDLSLHLVHRFGGPQLARACAKVLVLDRGRHSQAAYAISEFTRAQDELVQRAAALLSTDLAKRATIAEVAQQVGVTVRTLNRRFKRALGCTPQVYRSRKRIDLARQLLERPEQSVDAAARAVGYEDGSAFYRAFTRAVGMSPRDYQRRFGLSHHRGE